MDSHNNQKNNIDDVKEIRKLVIQNLNTINSLGSSLKDINESLKKKKDSESNRIFFVFIILCIVIVLAFFFYFRAEVVHFKEKLAASIRQETYLKKDIEDYKQKLFNIENNDIKAYNLYITLKEGEPDKAIKMYQNFNLSALSRLERLIIDSEVNLIKQKAALKKFEEGQTLFRRKSYAATIERMKESLEISSTGKHISDLFYITALSQYRLKEYNKAAITFERFLFVNTEKGFEKDKAELLLGVCFEKLKQYERALNFYQQIIRENKYTRFKPTIKDRMKLIRKKVAKQQIMDTGNNE